MLGAGIIPFTHMSCAINRDASRRRGTIRTLFPRTPTTSRYCFFSRNRVPVRWWKGWGLSGEGVSEARLWGQFLWRGIRVFGDLKSDSASQDVLGMRLNSERAYREPLVHDDRTILQQIVAVSCLAAWESANGRDSAFITSEGMRLTAPYRIRDDFRVQLEACHLDSN